MVQFTIPYYTILYYTILYYTILYYAIFEPTLPWRCKNTWHAYLRVLFLVCLFLATLFVSDLIVYMACLPACAGGSCFVCDLVVVETPETLFHTSNL